MDRTKLIEVILNRADTKENFRHALKYLSDTNLMALAIDLGIQTDEMVFQSLVDHTKIYNRAIKLEQL